MGRLIPNEIDYLIQHGVNDAVSEAFHLTGAIIGGRHFIYAKVISYDLSINESLHDTHIISIFEKTQDGVIRPVVMPDPDHSGAMIPATVEDDGTLNIEAFTDNRVAEVDGGRFLVTTGYWDDGLSVFRIDPETGFLTNTDNVSLGPDSLYNRPGVGQGVPVEVGDKTFVLVNASQANEVHVFELGADGVLSEMGVLTHDTARSQIDAVTSVNGVVFVVMDAGVFELTADGALQRRTAPLDEAIAELNKELIGDLSFVGSDGPGPLVGHNANGIVTFSLNEAGQLTLLSERGHESQFPNFSAFGVREVDGRQFLIGDIHGYRHHDGERTFIDFRMAAFEIGATGAIRAVETSQYFVAENGDSLYRGETFVLDGATYLIPATRHSHLLEITPLASPEDPPADELEPTDDDPGAEDPPTELAFNLVEGSADKDELEGGAGADQLAGYDGRDTLHGAGGDDRVLGGGGHDRIYGGDGADHLDGGDENDRVYGEAGEDTLIGGEGRDALYGGEGDDSLDGGAGKDRLQGDGGADVLNGGVGDDNARGGDGDDELFGEDGRDNLRGDAGDDHLFGGAGDDRANGGDGEDVLEGQTGDDRLTGGNGDDSVDGGEGDDRLSGGRGEDFLAGEVGADRLSGGHGADTIEGGAGDDRLSGGNDDDSLAGGDGADDLRGGNGDDSIAGGDGDDRGRGGGGADEILGGAGDDEIDGQRGDDALEGGAGDDTVEGGAGDDTLSGGDGADLLDGERDDDRIFGGDGADTLFGGRGDDELVGGVGDDLLFGERGADSFTFRIGDGADVIADFEDEDVIVIEGARSADTRFVEIEDDVWRIEYAPGDSIEVDVERLDAPLIEFVEFHAL